MSNFQVRTPQVQDLARAHAVTTELQGKVNKMTETGPRGPSSTHSPAERIWGQAQEQLRAMLSADTFNLWFAPLRAHALEQDCIVLEVANDFCEVWLKDNYMSLLEEVLTRSSGQPTRVKFKVTADSSLAHPARAVESTTSHKSSKTHEPAGEKSSGDFGFNPKNTFESFVVGNNNNFAHAAA
ncbi:MAG TPA: DnaA N-terminal domain-containing protein, partial [Verrucomicrobiae bacterium]|nr:DnaA N-terminal domain-containing protein [Verrucomicrobiae bacterium]